MRLPGFLFMGMSFLCAAEAPGPGYPLKPAWQSRRDTKDFEGDIRQVALDPATAEAFIATSVTLYRVRDGKTAPAMEPPAGKPYLVLAPGGNVVVWLLPHSKEFGLYQARVTNVAGRNLGRLELEEFPHGIGGAYLGHQGRFIATASPLEDREGLHGRFLYTFWSPDCKQIGRVEFPESRSVILDREGRAALFLRGARASCHRASGSVNWSLEGTFGDGAVAAGGKLALLRPAFPGNLREVWICRARESPEKATERAEMVIESMEKVEAPTQVHGLRIAQDLSRALLLRSDGKYSILELESRKLSEGAALLPANDKHRITDGDFVGPNRLAFGVRRWTGTPEKPTWLGALTIAVDLRGNVLVREDLQSSSAAGGFPRIQVDVRGRSYIAYTTEHAMCFRFEE